MKLVINFEKSQSIKTISINKFLRSLYHPKSASIIFRCLFKPTDTHIYLNSKSWYHEYKIKKKFPKLQLLCLLKICSNTFDYIKKSNVHLTFFIEKGYDSCKLKMLTCQKNPVMNSLHKIQKKKIEKAIMVTTQHPALKHLSQTLRKKYLQRFENDIYLKNVFRKKPIRQKMSVKKYIVETDLNEADEQKKLK